jgi:chromate reductase, NAD(P)H dehydrogenase (quinone)
MSVPGVLKNALDWASRPFGQSALIGKPVAVVGTSPLPSGATSALSDVGKLVSLIGATVVESDLAIGSVHTRFDEEGRISDTELVARMGQLFVKLVEAVTVEPDALKVS